MRVMYHIGPSHLSEHSYGLDLDGFKPCVSIFIAWATSEMAVDLDEAEDEEGMMSPSL